MEKLRLKANGRPLARLGFYLIPLFVCHALVADPPAPPAPPAPPPQEAPAPKRDAAPDREAPRTLEDVVDSVAPAVVTIEGATIPENARKPPTGSGILIDERGYILTSAHILENQTTAIVRFQNRRSVRTNTIFKDARTDLAVLKVDNTVVRGITPIQMHDSANIRLGREVFVVGAPFGFDGTITRGIVSGKNRMSDDLPYADLIQTDAALNPGNSGGPLFCMDGKCIGIIHAIHSKNGTNTGVGFAIAGGQVRFVADHLIRHGRVIRGYIGATINNLSQDNLERLGIAHGTELTELVEGDTPARKAGLLAGDILINLNDEPIHGARPLMLKLSQTAPGTKIRFSVLRNRETTQIEVEVGRAPDAASR